MYPVFVVFDGLFYINNPRLSHNGMENPRTTMFKCLLIKMLSIAVLELEVILVGKSTVLCRL